MCQGRYPAVRAELNSRGWVENLEHEKDVVPIPAFNLYFSVASKSAFEMELSDNQYINHFEGTRALTTKVGLVHIIKSLSRQHALDGDSFFPQCYDLTNGAELNEFKEDFNFCQVVAFLKSALQNGQASLEERFNSCLFALHFCKVRLEAFSPAILSAKSLDYFKPMTEQELNIFTRLEEAAYEEMPLWEQLKQTDLNPQTLQKEIEETLERVKHELLGKQFDLIGTKNAWILKPGGKSRGRGIQVCSSYETII